MAVSMSIAFENNPKGVYYAGQRVAGVIKGNARESLRARGIKLGYKGFIKTHWTQKQNIQVPHENDDGSEGTKSKQVTVNYGDEEVFFNTELVLWGTPGSGGTSTQVISAGEFTYPFQFDLPNNLPSSYEGGLGQVRYSIEVKIDRPGKQDIHCKSMLSVISVVDLNTTPHWNKPVVGHNSKTIGMLCCADGEMKITAKIPRGAFCSGEYLDFEVEIENESGKKIKSVEGNLTQQVTYRGKKHDHHDPGEEKQSKDNQKTIKSLIYEHTDIAGGESHNWKGRIKLATLPPTYNHKIINLAYTLQFVVVPGGFSTRFSSIMPVVIGSIPLRSTFNQLNSNKTPSAPLLSIYPDLPPPSYGQCFGGCTVDTRNGRNKEECIGGNAATFSPAYPHY